MKDSTGAVWAKQHGFVGARASTKLSSKTSIAGTSDPELYRAGIFGMTSFKQALPNGTYTVVVKMSENFWKKAGVRVFSVTAEGKTVLSNIDIYKAVGYRHAYDRTFTVTVKDGTLNLGFKASKNYAEIMALYIARNPDKASTSTPAKTSSSTSSAQPGASNTGVPAGQKLTKHNGDLVVTKAGATYSNLDIYGYVTIQAPNVTIKNSIVRGAATPAPQGSWALVTDVDAKATNFVIQDSELVPRAPSMWVDGIKGWNYTALRVNIHGTVDTAKVYGNNATIEDSWLHGTIYYNGDPTASGGHTHNDGVQVLSGKNIHILNNTITGANNAGMQVTQNNGVVTGLYFQGNWADGGGCTVNLSAYPRPTMTGINVSYNKFGSSQRVKGCAIVSGPETTLTAVGNVWASNGTVAKVSRGS